MKKFAACFIAVALIISSAFAQESLQFQMQYKPQTKYTQAIEQKLFMEINYTGSKEMMDAIAATGTKNPTINKTETNLESVIRTGIPNDSATFPVSMEFTKTSGASAQAAISPGTIFYGHCSVGKYPNYDSVYSPDGKEAEAMKIADLISKTLLQVKFPEKRMKPGDEFRQELPMSVATGVGKFDLTSVTIYKLKSIKDNIGFFDLSVDYVAKVATEGMELPMKGTGAGKMEFDALNGFFINYQINLDVDTNMDVKGMGIKMKSNSTMSLHSTIESL